MYILKLWKQLISTHSLCILSVQFYTKHNSIAEHTVLKGRHNITESFHNKAVLKSFFFLNTALKDCPFWQNVDIHARCRALCVCENHSRGGSEGPQVQGEVCLPSRVHHEWVHRAAKTLRHHEGGRKPRLQGLRNRHTERILIKVGGIV